MENSKNNIESKLSEWTLSFDEAVVQMLDGKKICHKYFFDWEWLQLYQQNSKLVINEDSATITREEFYKLYGEENFTDGWAIFQV